MGVFFFYYYFWGGGNVEYGCTTLFVLYCVHLMYTILFLPNINEQDDNEP